MLSLYKRPDIIALNTPLMLLPFNGRSGTRQWAHLLKILTTQNQSIVGLSPVEEKSIDIRCKESAFMSRDSYFQ